MPPVQLAAHSLEPAAAAAEGDRAADALPAKLRALRAELVELAFDLDCRGWVHAADLASIVAARLGELCGVNGGPSRTQPGTTLRLSHLRKPSPPKKEHT